MVGLIALLLFPPSKDFREAMKGLVYFFPMRKQLSLPDTALAVTVCGNSIGNIWIIHKSIAKNLAYNQNK